MGEWKDVVLGEVAEVCLGKMLDQHKNRGQYRVTKWDTSNVIPSGKSWN